MGEPFSVFMQIGCIYIYIGRGKFRALRRRDGAKLSLWGDEQAGREQSGGGGADCQSQRLALAQRVISMRAVPPAGSLNS